MATFFAVRAGLKDAREGKPAYFWAIFTGSVQRKELLKEGWKAVGRVFVAFISAEAPNVFMPMMRLSQRHNQCMIVSHFAFQTQ
jgi:hypothetical protein